MKHLYITVAAPIVIALSTGCDSSPKSFLNDKASVHVSDELPENPLLMKPVTSSVNPGDSTMSTLYGNETAFSHAETKGDTLYPEGAVLYEVSWKQQPDSVWFGANIPNEIITVERVRFDNTGSPDYTLYSGKPLRRTASDKATHRISFIRSQKMAVSP